MNLDNVGNRVRETETRATQEDEQSKIERTKEKEIQVHSYYKMRSNFFVPIPSIEGSTGPNWMKFCMGPSKGISRVTIEGFFDIRSGGPDMGYPWGPRRGPDFLKKFFSIFFIFFQQE